MPTFGQQNSAQGYAFLAYGETRYALADSVAVTATMDLYSGTRGLPATAMRVWSDDPTANVFIAFGGKDITVSVTTGMPLPAGMAAPQVVRILPGSTYCAIVTDVGTANVYLTPGEGVN